MSDDSKPKTPVAFPDPPAEVIPRIKILRTHPEAYLPFRAHESDVGFDLAACLISETGRRNKALVPAQNSRRIPTRICALPPPGYFLAVCSRSGLATQTPPLFVANAPGIIDPEYTGEIDVILFNGGFSSIYIEHGQRIAQLVVLPLWRGNYEEILELPKTERGTSGYGSTGK